MKWQCQPWWTIFEFIENWTQFFNMRSIYLCMLPLEWCIIFAAILICESMYRACIMAKKIWLSKQGQDQITVREKDFQLGVDIFVDSFFLIAPNIASIIACKITSPSECPSRPEWKGILTPPRYSFLFFTNL